MFRGDYGQHLQELYGLPLLNREYFLIAMDYFRSKYENIQFTSAHRRRINTEEKAKVVAAWGDRILINFLATCLHQDDSSNRPVALHFILQIILVQNSKRGKEFNQLCPPSSDDLCLLFCINTSSMLQHNRYLHTKKICILHLLTMKEQLNLSCM